MKKAIVVGISFLCIITFLISSQAVIIAKASVDTHIAKVTSQVYGVRGFGDTTVHLTEQQYRTLRNYLKTFQERLNQTTTREEALTLFREAIVELDVYGLLPKGMTANQTLHAVSGEHTKLMPWFFKKTKQVFPLVDANISSRVINLFCFFYAHTWFAFEDSVWVLLEYIVSSFDLKIFDTLGSLMFYYSIFKPFRFMNRIWVAGPGLGGYTYGYYTVGLLGIRKGGDDFSIAHGFSGIKLIMDDQLEAVYLGRTLLALKK
jgi:hypothetical protein